MADPCGAGINNSMMCLLENRHLRTVGYAVVQGKVESSCSILNITWLKRMGLAFMWPSRGKDQLCFFVTAFPRAGTRGVTSFQRLQRPDFARWHPICAVMARLKARRQSINIPFSTWSATWWECWMLWVPKQL